MGWTLLGGTWRLSKNLILSTGKPDSRKDLESRQQAAVVVPDVPPFHMIYHLIYVATHLVACWKTTNSLSCLLVSTLTNVRNPWTTKQRPQTTTGGTFCRWKVSENTKQTVIHLPDTPKETIHHSLNWYIVVTNSYACEEGFLLSKNLVHHLKKSSQMISRVCVRFFFPSAHPRSGWPQPSETKKSQFTSVGRIPTWKRSRVGLLKSTCLVFFFQKDRNLHRAPRGISFPKKNIS